ncbi:MAG: GGDEF domain-containing protein, partial [Cocleimonas sp.]
MFKLLSSNQRSLQDQLVLFGTALPCFLILPFSLYRVSIGDYAIGAIDLIIALSLVTIFSQTYSSKKIRYLNITAVTICLIAVSWVMHMKGLSMVFWAFPSMGFTYFVLKSKEALIANILFMSAITFIFFDVLTKNQALSIYPSLILVCLFGFAFSLCSESQNKKLLKLVSEDTLTGVKNRRSFDEKLEEVLANYKRSPSKVSMLLLDLDYFKKINDSHGHKQGDQVLIDFAQTVKSIIRSTDCIYRFGGEEFVVIAYSSLENSGVLGDSIREFIKISPSLSKYNVTVSIGVSEIEAEDDADSFFRRADNALYEAKSSGRNRVRLARLDENNQVYCEPLSHYPGVKPVSSKMHYLLRPDDDKKPKNI